MAGLLSSDPQAHVLAVAPTNVAVVKLVMEMEQAMQVLGEVFPMVALFSGAGKVVYQGELDYIGDHLLTTTVEAEEFKQVLEQLEDADREREKNMVRKYVRACVVNPRAAQEAAVAAVVQRRAGRRMMFATLSFAEQVPRLMAETTHLVIDEAGRAPMVQVISFVSHLPQIRKLLVLGDRRQLSVHVPSLPLAVRTGFGLGSIVQSLDVSPGVDHTVLEVCYRSHPTIVRCVEAACYAPHGERLLPGCEERAMLTAHVRLPTRGVPLVLLHQEGVAIRDAISLSSVDMEQTHSVMRIVWHLYTIFGRDLSVRCVCFYGAQARSLQLRVDELQPELKHVTVTTCDRTQGHEADLTIVVTTCSEWSAQAAGVPFWAAPERVDVAISRAKHGTYLIGDLLLLRRSEVWRAFLDKAMEETEVVGAEYLDAMLQQGSRYSAGGSLLMEDGHGVRSQRYYERYRGGRFAQGSSGTGSDFRYKPYNSRNRARPRR